MADGHAPRTGRLVLLRGIAGVVGGQTMVGMAATSDASAAKGAAEETFAAFDAEQRIVGLMPGGGGILDGT